MPSAKDSERSVRALEQMLAAFDQPAILLAGDRRVLAVNRLFENVYDRWRPGGDHRCYSLLHGRRRPCDPAKIFCPLERTLETRQPVRTVHVHSSGRGESHVTIVTRLLSLSPEEPALVLQILKPIEISSPDSSADRLVGRSAPFNEMLARITGVARTSSPVLVSGEPGSGKEMVARKIHELGDRTGAPFVSIDCGALRERPFEREVFGHVQGSRSDSEGSFAGLVGAADGGTLFLDDVDELPTPLQSKFLRLVESGRYRPEGSPEELLIDLRLISSTSADLETAVGQGLFRSDFLLAISALRVAVPALRERTEDLPVLVESLLKRLCRSHRLVTVEPEALTILAEYDFPGNVRELRTILERACALSECGPLRPRHLRIGTSTRGENEGRHPGFRGEIRPLRELVRSYVRWAAETTGLPNRELAKRLGISERTLYRRLSTTTADPVPPNRRAVP